MIGSEHPKTHSAPSYIRSMCRDSCIGNIACDKILKLECRLTTSGFFSGDCDVSDRSEKVFSYLMRTTYFRSLQASHKERRVRAVIGLRIIPAENH